MNKPKFVIAIRHGDYSERNLTQKGIEDISSVAEKIKDLIVGKSVALFTSPTTRTVETSCIIAEKFGIEAIKCDSLRNDRYINGQSQMKDIMDLIGDNNPEVVIAVTHFTAPSGIIDAFANEFLGNTVVGKMEIEKGRALILDLSTAEYDLIVP